MDLFNKALYGGFVPAALALALVGLALWHARRHPGQRPAASAAPLAALAAPVAAAVAIGLSFLVQFSGPSERWHRLVYVAPALLAIWSVALMLPDGGQRRRALLTAGASLAAALAAGIILWPAILPALPQWMHALPFAAAGLMAAALFPVAMERPSPWDGLAVAAAGALLSPTIVFSGQGKFGELLLPAAVAAGLACVLSAAVRAEGRQGWREGVSAGAAGIALLLPMWAIVTWSYGRSDLTPRHGWALAIVSLAPVLITVRLIPALSRRPLVGGIIAVALVALAAAIGFAMVYTRTDTAAYDPGF